MYFFSFIYNMLKCQKEEKGFCKTQKYELQLLPAACCFQKNELELFLEDWPRRPPSSPDASGLPAFPPLSSIFFTSFPFSVPSIFQFLCRQLTYTACNTSSLVLPVVRTLRFHYFFVRSILILSQVATLSSGVSRPHLTRIILIHPQVRTSRSGLPAIRFPYLFLSKHSQPFTSHHTFFRRQPAISYPQHSYQFSSQNLALRLAGHYFRYIILT